MELINYFANLSLMKSASRGSAPDPAYLIYSIRSLYGTGKAGTLIFEHLSCQFAW